MQFFLQLNSPLGPGFGPSLTLSTIPAGVVTPSVITLQQALNGIPITVPNNTTVVVITSTGDTSCIINFAVPTTTQDPCLNSGGTAVTLPTTCGIGVLNCTVLPPGFTTTTTTTSTPTTTTSSTTTSTSTSTTSTTTINPCATAICGVTYEGYGYLYNWYAIYGNGTLPIPSVVNGRNVGGIVNTNQPSPLPNTWVVPSDDDWTTLITYLGGQSIAGGKLKTTCSTPFGTNNGLWISPNAAATNEVNFAAVPGGYRLSNTGIFNLIGQNGIYWSSTEATANNAFYRDLYFSNGSVFRTNYGKAGGLSVRLVRPATVAEQALPDGATSISHPSILKPYIGNEIATLPGPTIKRNFYITVKINNQIWTAQNLIEETYNNGSLISEETNNSTWSTITTGRRCSYNNGSITANQGQIQLCGKADASICISSAGYSAANGTYTYVGQFNSRSQYTYNNGTDIFEITWYNSPTPQWTIFSNTAGMLYTSSQNVSNPYLVTNWVATNASYLPLPVINLGTC